MVDPVVSSNELAFDEQDKGGLEIRNFVKRFCSYGKYSFLEKFKIEVESIDW